METLRTYLNNLKSTEQIEFATQCGTTIGYLRKVMSSKTGYKLGEKICIEIEDKTNGQVTCEELRPDVNWSIIRGKKIKAA